MIYQLVNILPKRICKTPTLRSDLFDYNDVHIVVKRRIYVTGTFNAKRRNKKLTLKNNAPFRSCI